MKSSPIPIGTELEWIIDTDYSNNSEIIKYLPTKTIWKYRVIDHISVGKEVLSKLWPIDVKKVKLLNELGEAVE